MAGDYGSGQGGIQTSTSTEFTPKGDGVPKTGFDEAPKGQELRGGPGPGVPANKKTIS